MRNEAMGRVIARAWTDNGFKDRLLADAKAALAELKMTVPEGKSVTAAVNTPSLVHVVLTSPRYTETNSAYADIKRFGESYRDPRLFPLNWGSHDPVFTARYRKDPKAALQAMGVNVPDGIAVIVVENTMTKAHLVVPARPSDAEMSKDVLDRVAAGLIPPAMRYAALFEPVTYRQFF